MSNIENFRNLMNHHQQQIELDKQQKEQADKRKSEENKDILDKLGLPQFLQSIIDEDLIQIPRKTIEVEYSVKNSKVLLFATDHDIDHMDQDLFEAHVMKDKKVVMIKGNSIKNNYGYLGKIITPDNMAQLVFNSIINKPSSVSVDEYDWVNPFFDQNI